MSRLYFLALLVITSGLLSAQQPAASGVDWQPQVAAAMKLAKKENRPIMVAFILRGEPANEQICGDHFRDEEIIALSREFVCLLAFATFSSPDATASTVESDALLKSLEGRVSLKQLAKVEMDSRIEWMESGQVSAPQFLFLKPDGESFLLRHVWLLDRSELLLKMHKALHFFDSAHELPATVKEQVRAEGDLVADLLIRSNENNMNTRRDAMSDLADHDDPRVVDFLIQQTGPDVDQAKRLEAIDAMGREGGAKFLPRLHELLRKEKSFQVRTNVADALRRIGMVESAKPLLKVLKSERKSRARSLLLRALISCGGAREEVLREVEKLLVRGSELDQITIMSELTSVNWDDRFRKGLLKCLKSNDSKVRTAACWLAGKHKVTAARKPMKMRFSTEKGAARNACAWALAELGESVKVAGTDPSSDVTSSLPYASY